MLCFLALGGHCLQMLCLPGFGTHPNTQNLPHFRAFPASMQEHSPPKCLFFMANAKLPNRPGFALLRGGPFGGFQIHFWAIFSICFGPRPKLGSLPGQPNRKPRGRLQAMKCLLPNARSSRSSRPDRSCWPEVSGPGRPYKRPCMRYLRVF